MPVGPHGPGCCPCSALIHIPPGGSPGSYCGVPVPLTCGTPISPCSGQDVSRRCAVSGALHVCTVQDGLHMPLAGGEGRRHHVRELHGIQPEEGTQGGAHEPPEGRLREGATAGAGDRAAPPTAGRRPRAGQGRACCRPTPCAEAGESPGMGARAVAWEHGLGGLAFQERGLVPLAGSCR